MSPTITFADISEAAARLDDESIVRRTPIEYSRSLSNRTDADVHLKMEHLQRTGSFKTRGAYNKLQQLSAEGDVSRVVAASAGNHAQGVALAATKVGIESTVVMPTTAPQTKVDATRGYGADVVLEGRTFQQALAHARTLADEEGTRFVHAYDDPDIVAGQGTLGVELYEQLPSVDTVVVPVGGGGLVGGVATALSALDDDVRIVGVQASGAATVPESLQKGQPVEVPDPDTIADGIATGGISELTFSLIRDHVDEVVVVDDDAIAEAMLALLERAKQLVEGAGAASVAALLHGDVDAAGEQVVPILGGGNIDISSLQSILTHALTGREQLLHLRVRIEDRPGKMGEISAAIGREGANIQSVRHDRSIEDLSVGEAYLVFRVLTNGESHSEAVVSAVESKGYTVERGN
ncbi:threonine ammonia-lyase [Haloplanus sp. GCM10025708]|uniref:threonine ammonia-lyase n=1 Tax=Haloferacaceae TaxID=1644056 RepID=UPI003620C204